MIKYYQDLIKEYKDIAKWKAIHLKMLITLGIMKLKLEILKF